MPVRLLKSQCKTCVFRAGNLMHLDPGRLAGMVKDCKDGDTHIPCHETIDYSDVDEDGTGAGSSVVGGPASICAGFAERYEPTILQLARRLDYLELIDPPE